MKKHIILLSVAAALLCSCNQEWLDIPQKGVITMESFYQTDEDAESAVTAMYNGFATNVCSYRGNNVANPWMFAFNLPGDDVLAGGKGYRTNTPQEGVTEFYYDSSNEIISYCYQYLYYANYYCNLVTDNFKYGDSPVKDRCISEARVLRAWIHMTLAIGWGTPPLIDHVLEGSAKPYNCDKDPDNPMTHEELLKWCAQECLDAAKYLDERKNPQDKNNTIRVTKGLAWTVAGKSLLFAGDYAGAKAALKNVIDSKKYELVPGDRFFELFHIEGDGNEEKIFESNVVYTTAVSQGTIRGITTWQHQMMWAWRTDRMAGVPKEVGVGANGWGGLGVREDYAEEFYAHDGDSYRRKATMVSFDEMLYDFHYASDVAEDGHTLTLEEKKKDPKRGIKDIQGMYANGRFLQFKRISSPEDVAGHVSFSCANFTIFRYAEVLLMYAECCAQTGDNSGLQYLQAIQERSGSGKISETLTLDAVKKEKKYEMWGEGCRWADCVRWGDIDGMLISGDVLPTLFDKFFDAENPTPEHQYEVRYFGYNSDRPHGFVKGKHELFPFPFLETSKNPNIVQNPGW